MQRAELRLDEGAAASLEARLLRVAGRVRGCYRCLDRKVHQGQGLDPYVIIGCEVSKDA